MWILRMVARLKSMAVAASSRESFISTTSAESMAMSVPAPMAMPMSARVSAGASLMPSPTMATLWPCSCKRRMTASFCVGSTSAMASPMSSLFADGLGGLAVVTGEHDHVEAHLAEAADGGAAGLAHGVGYGDDAEDAALAGEEQRCLALAGETPPSARSQRWYRCRFRQGRRRCRRGRPCRSAWPARRGRKWR